MWSKNRFLKECADLKEQGFPFVQEQGRRIARGYADLGYEEFVLLTDDKLLSLYSGKPSEIPEGHSRHFFLVPTCDEMVDEISKRGFDIETLEFKDQRVWKVVLSRGGVSLITEVAPTLEQVLILALKQIVMDSHEKR